jgi:hypothetical protein
LSLEVNWLLPENVEVYKAAATTPAPTPTAARIPLPSLFPGLLGIFVEAVACVTLLDVLVVEDVDVVVVVVEAVEELVDDEADVELEEPDEDVAEAEEGRPVPVDWILKAGE